MPVAESLSTAVLVKETRKRLGLAQVQFAQELGVSFQSVNRWEHGKTKPLPIVLKQSRQWYESSAIAVPNCWRSILLS